MRLLLSCILPSAGLILADAVPLAVAADFRAFAGGDDVLLDVLGEFGKWKGLAFCQAALGKYGVVIALYFFSCLAESLTVVGTGRADFVCVYGETDVCAFCKKLQHFLHMGCKSIAVAVSDKKTPGTSRDEGEWDMSDDSYYCNGTSLRTLLDSTNARAIFTRSGMMNGNYAPAQYGSKSNSACGSRVYNHEPDGSHCVAYKQSYNHGNDLYYRLLAPEGFDCPHCKCGE